MIYHHPKILFELVIPVDTAHATFFILFIVKDFRRDHLVVKLMLVAMKGIKVASSQDRVRNSNTRDKGLRQTEEISVHDISDKDRVRGKNSRFE